jgi:sugar O-acyltransferase (sialic acid O-acetyltransferase NeuD family)
MEIFIIGSGGFAKEVLWLIEEINARNKKYSFSGFIDFKPKFNSISIADNSYPVFDEDEWLNQYLNNSTQISVAIGIGNPKTIKNVSDKFKHFNFPNLIHPSFKSHLQTAKLGNGNIITAGCIFTVNIKIGSFNIFNLNTTIGHDVNIGNGNVINPGCNISGGISIGNFNLLGTNSTLLQNITLGDNSILGAASLANKNIESNKVCVGVPAKIIKENV